MSMRPVVDVSLVPEAPTVTLDDHRTLVIGHSTTATANVIQDNTTLQSDANINTAFGAKSQMALMLRSLKLVNKVSRVDALPVAAAGGATNTTLALTITFRTAVTTLATAQSIAVVIGGRRFGKINVDLAVGDTASGVATKINTAINAVTNLPISSTVATNVVTITVGAPGVSATHIGVEFEHSTDVFASFAKTAGTGDLDLAGVVAAIGDRRYQTIVLPASSDSTANTVITLLNARFNASGVIRDGACIRFTSGATSASLVTALNARDSASEVILLAKAVSKTLNVPSGTLPAGTYTNAIRPSVFEFPEVIQAMVAGVRALRLTDGASIARFVSASTGARDAFGGSAIASLPYFNTPIIDQEPIPLDDAWTAAEVDSLTDAGGTVFYNNDANTGVLLGDARTTYKTTSVGELDTTFAPLNHVDTASVAREKFFRELKSRFRQSRLTQGDVQPGRNMANGSVVAAFLDNVYLILSGEDFVLTQAGEDARRFFRNNRTVTLDMANGRVIVDMITPLVTQLREILVTMRIGFDIE